MTIKGKHILTSVALTPDQHAYLADRAATGGSMSALVRKAIGLLMAEDMKNNASKEIAACGETAVA